MFLIRSWKVLKMCSTKSWGFGSLKILWLLPYIGYSPFLRDHKNNLSTDEGRTAVYFFIRTHTCYYICFCKWIMKENTKFLDAGHITNPCIPTLSFFLFSQSLCLFFPFWIQDLFLYCQMTFGGWSPCDISLSIRASSLIWHPPKGLHPTKDDDWLDLNNDLHIMT